MARENRQRIEAEKRTVHEAKMELDKHRKKVEDMETKYSSVREQLGQLPEDMEPLKVEFCCFQKYFEEPKPAAADSVAAAFL